MLFPGIVIAIAGETESAAEKPAKKLLTSTTHGVLDRRFGEQGQVKTEFADATVANAVLLQPDAKIIVVGHTLDTREMTGFALARYLADGRIDKDFGRSGIVYTRLKSKVSRASAAVLQADGKIVVVGSSGDLKKEDFAVLRYNANGSVDSSFGDGGGVLTDFGGNSDKAFAVMLQADGKIVVGGFCNGGNSADLLWADFALVRYNPDGSLDRQFGNGGKVVAPAGSYIDEIHALAIQPDGKILAAGYTGADNAGSVDVALLRFQANGSLDKTFGNAGRVITDLGAREGAHALALQADGKILVAGYRESEQDTDFMLLRYHADGSLDPGFGDKGKVLTDFLGRLDEAYAMAITAADRIILAGRAYEQDGEIYLFAMARYTADGHLDTSFGEEGKVRTDFGYSRVEANAIAIQPDGKIVLAGSASVVDSGNFFAIARYQP